MTVRLDANAPDTETFEPRWTAHPHRARALQFVVLVVPVGASLVCAYALSRTLPHARHIGAALAWWAVVVVVSTIVLFAVDRLARRLLPLAVLLRLSLLFPDQAPKRYRIAARAWNTRKIQRRIATMSERDEPTEAAAGILALLASLAAHDRRTRGHCERVRAFNDLLAVEMKLPEADRERARWAALIHDIGKLAVPARLLNKPAKPTSREWNVLRAHPLRGAQIAAPLAEWLGPWAKAIEEHHERWDGTGYPHGLAGTDISLAGRIVAVADAFEVMTTARPYSRAVTAAAARAELASCAGAQFDPAVVRAFLSISIGKLRKVMGPMALLAQIPLLASMPRLEAKIVGGSRQAVSGAGAAAGVVAVTSLSPHGAIASAHHAHVPVAPAPTMQTVAAKTTPVHAVAAVVSHHKQPAATTVEHRRTTTATRAPATTSVPAATAQTMSAPKTTQPNGSTPSGASGKGHGRCDGNSGKGVGNGGPNDGASHRTPPRAARAHRHAPGRNACDCG